MIKETSMKKAIWIFIAVLIIVIGGGISSYNGLVSMNEEVHSSWAQVDTQLQRRADLIPNLVNTVKGYASHEEKAIHAVADARSKLLGAQSPPDRIAANGELSSALGRLLMVAENYPNLKANQNFQALQDELAGTENRIAVSRRDYNNVVQKFNAKIRSFPTNLYAGIMGFSEAPYFKADPGASAAPKVQF